MTAKRAFEYWQAITCLEAREQINLLNIRKFIHYKKEYRKRFEKELRKQSQSNLIIKKKVLTTEEIVKQLMKE